MRRVSRLVDALWFRPAPAARPAVLRVMLGGYVLWYVGRRYRLFLKIARSDPEMFRPVGAAAYLERPVSVATFRRVLLATLVANAAFALGWKHRYTGPLFSALLLWVLSYRNSWSMIYHSDNVLVIHALILGLTPSADALSLDAAARAVAAAGAEGWSGAHGELDGRDHWRYGWPVQLMGGVTVLTYFVSGVAKVAGPLGWGWASGEALRRQVAVDGLRKEIMGGGAPTLARRLYPNVFLFRAIGVGSLAVELAAPVALTDRRLARLWAVHAFLMHWGILFVMGIRFRYQLSGLIFASFFDVERVVAPLTSRTPRRAAARWGWGAGPRV